MARSLRTRPRLNRTILSLTKGATSFVYAASCNNNTASLTDFYFPSLVPVAIFVGNPSVPCHAPCAPASWRLVTDRMFGCSVRSSYCTERVIYLQLLVSWDSDP